MRSSMGVLCALLLVACDGGGDSDAGFGSDGGARDAGGPGDGGGASSCPPAADSVGYEGSFPAAPEILEHVELTVGGLTREMALYVPPGRASAPALILAFHGTGGGVDDGVWDTEANNLADENDQVLVVSPHARTMADGDWDQHGPGDIYFDTTEQDADVNADLLLVRAIIEEAVATWGVDRCRVYTAGFSNGAFFAQFVAMRMPDRIAGFVSGSGGFVECSNTSDCHFAGTGTTCEDFAGQAGWCDCSGYEHPAVIPTTGHQPAGWIAHAADDDIVSPYYSCRLAAQLDAAGFTYELHLRESGGHTPPPDMMRLAWPFLDAHRLP
ncbi:MAG: hypothetical protein KC619_20340 [Myxococcales bacterium]|nr:hypothetical protein [Myxococcales bacterium]